MVLDNLLKYFWGSFYFEDNAFFTLKGSVLQISVREFMTIEYRGLLRPFTSSLTDPENGTFWSKKMYYPQ